MDHEERAKVIKRIFYLVLAIAILTGVYFYPKPKVDKPTLEVPNDALIIEHYHLPGDAASEQIADTFNKIQKKYDKLVEVRRIDAKKQPEIAKTQGITKLPHVVFTFEKRKVYEFQGLFSEEQIEKKVDEILRGLKRIDKDWRPPVSGMKPAEH